MRALDARTAGCAEELARAGEPVRYLGSILMREDEVVLCLFDGTEDGRSPGRRAGRGSVRADPRGHPLALAAPEKRLKEAPCARSHRIRIALAAVGAVALAAGAVWRRPPAPPGRGSAAPPSPAIQLGLARTADGVLHVIWNRGNSATSIFETRLSPAGKAVGTSTVATGWNGNGGLALVVMPDKTLRLFAPGTGGINTFTAPATGGSWTHQSGVGWGGAIAESAYVIGATLTKDGQPVTAWRGNAAEGVPPASIPQAGYQGGMASRSSRRMPPAARSSSPARRTPGRAASTPSRSCRAPARTSSCRRSGRNGATGSAAGSARRASTSPTPTARPCGSTATAAARRRSRPAPYWSATVCAGPEGRLWLAWADTAGGLFVTRSNRAPARLEPVQKLRLPPAPGSTFLQCEGSAGPADLFASDTNGGFFHTHVLAQLSLRARAAKAKATISARDAGDPVAGAAIAVAGQAREDRRTRTRDAGAPARLVLGFARPRPATRPHRSGSRSR